MGCGFCFDGRDLADNAIESIPAGFLDGATSLQSLSVLRRGHALGICMRVVRMVSVLGLKTQNSCVSGLAAVYCDEPMCDMTGP